MREAERKKLIKLIEEAHKKILDEFHEHTMAVLKEKGSFNSKTDIDRRNMFELEADYLLDNGAIVPSYEIGQTVYVIGNDLFWCGEISKFWYSKDNSCERFRFDVLFSDKTVETISERDIFPTKAEAEYALKNRRSVSLVNGHIEE